MTSQLRYSIVGNINNTEIPTTKPTPALAKIRRKRRYFVFSTVSSILCKYLIFCGGTQVLEIVIFQLSLNRFRSNKDVFCHFNIMFFQI